MREYEYERESNWFQLVAGEVPARRMREQSMSRRCVMEIPGDMKTRGPLYKLAVHGVEPRGGEAPPHPRRFPTNSNFHQSPKHLRPSQNTYRFSPLSQNT